jgi:hypothetical protein
MIIYCVCIYLYILGCIFLSLNKVYESYYKNVVPSFLHHNIVVLGQEAGNKIEMLQFDPVLHGHVRDLGMSSWNQQGLPRKRNKKFFSIE